MRTNTPPAAAVASTYCPAVKHTSHQRRRVMSAPATAPPTNPTAAQLGPARIRVASAKGVDAVISMP